MSVVSITVNHRTNFTWLHQTQPSKTGYDNIYGIGPDTIKAGRVGFIKAVRNRDAYQCYLHQQVNWW